MHSYLKAIGFSTINHIDDLNALIQDTLENPDAKSQYETKGGRKLGEFFKFCGDGSGLKIVGEYDRQGQFHREYLMPFFVSDEFSCNEPVIVEKRLETDSYYGICEDVRIGTTLIFRILNGKDYHDYLWNHPDAGEDEKNRAVILSALAHNGTILFPVEPTVDPQETKRANRDRRELIKAAQNGDPDAMESLSLEEYDTYTMLAERIEHEDILSIVDTCFMPSGIECDEYNVIGTIRNVEKTKNPMSQEELVLLDVITNDVPVRICINQLDLTGEPEAGRRFKGNIWLQGFVFF